MILGKTIVCDLEQDTCSFSSKFDPQTLGQHKNALGNPAINRLISNLAAKKKHFSIQFNFNIYFTAERIGVLAFRILSSGKRFHTNKSLILKESQLCGILNVVTGVLKNLSRQQKTIAGIFGIRVCEREYQYLLPRRVPLIPVTIV